MAKSETLDSPRPERGAFALYFGAVTMAAQVVAFPLVPVVVKAFTNVSPEVRGGIGGLVVGALVGAGQWWVLKKRIQALVPASKRDDVGLSLLYIAMTAAAWAVAEGVYARGLFLPPYVTWLLLGGAVGAVQATTATKKTSLTIGWTVAAAVGFGLRELLGALVGAQGPWLYGLGLLIPGVCVGFAAAFVDGMDDDDDKRDASA